MAFSFVATNSAVGTGVTALTVPVPAGLAVGDLLVLAIAVEGVASGSGPWTIPNTGQLNPDGLGPAKGWQLVASQAPSGTGEGLEVWAAIFSAGTQTVAHFATAQNVVGVMGAWRGEYNPTNLIAAAPPRLAPSLQVTGGQPPAPAVSPNVGELLIACAADLMGGAGYGSPSGFTNRVDVARAGAGTVEATLADQVATVAGSTGLITFPNAAAAGTTKGTTATLVFVPAPTAAGAGALFDAPLPPELDLADGWTLRVTALDPVTGAVVPGVTVSGFAVEAELGAGTSAGDLAVGQYLLVPGPGA